MKMERLSEQNIHLLPELHKQVYGKSPAPEFFRKKFGTLYGHRHLGFIAIENNKAIAFCGAMPQLFGYQGKKWLAAQSLEALTHPQHRNKGLFLQLSKEVINLAKQLEFAFVIGFPNQNIAPSFFKHLGYINLHHLDCFVISCNSNLMSYFRRWVRGKSPLSIMNNGNRRLPEFYQATASAGTLINEEYLNYKSFTSNFFTEINGNGLWLKTSQRLDIGNIQVRDEADFSSLIESLKKTATISGLKEIVYQCSPTHTSHKMFSRIVSPIQSWPVAVHDFNSGFPFDKLAITYSDVDVF
jgi:hypothetical protein